jgi:hypothetical protein
MRTFTSFCLRQWKEVGWRAAGLSGRHRKTGQTRADSHREGIGGAPSGRCSHRLQRRLSLSAAVWVLPLALLLSACSASLPTDYAVSARKAKVLPDNDGATIPPNIAPLDLAVQEPGDDYAVCVYTKKNPEGLVADNATTDWDVDAWHDLLQEAKGDTLFTAIYVKRQGRWTRFGLQKNPIAPEPVDPYITYRLIEPSYIDYEEMTLNQRNVTNFDERVIYNNMMLSDGDQGQCVNCHVPKDYNRGHQSQFHVRQYKGGTVLIKGNQAVKVELKTDSTLSSGVYPAWHPQLDLIAYSTNATGQVFHTRDRQKVEVIDYGSDLILYDVNQNKVYNIDHAPDEFESFPSWSPDGKALYYVSAHYEARGDIDSVLDLHYKDLKYNIYRRSFNPSTLKFGPRELVFDAASVGKSAAFPRVSPDGRWLLFSLADYGQFHIWHKSSDLYALDLSRPAAPRPLSEANSPDVDSYHAWSSNGRWILFSSRRGDGNYTRLYLAYFDKAGRAHRALLLPQRDPTYYHRLFKSYNVPEWMVNPVEPSANTLRQAISGDARPAQFGGEAIGK